MSSLKWENEKGHTQILQWEWRDNNRATCLICKTKIVKGDKTVALKVGYRYFTHAKCLLGQLADEAEKALLPQVAASVRDAITTELVLERLGAVKKKTRR